MNKLIAAGLLLIAASAAALAQTTVVGFESGALAVTGTPANSSHAGGTAVGPATALPSNPGGTNQSGLFVIPLARNTGGSLIMTQFSMTSSGGSTGQYVVRIWSRLPANTTCVDNIAFAGNFTTDDAYLVTPPFALTPVAPASTTGDANTYASVTVQTYDVQNTDSPPTRNIYVCLQTVSTDTADENKAIRVMASGPQN